MIEWIVGVGLGFGTGFVLGAVWMWRIANRALNDYERTLDER